MHERDLINPILLKASKIGCRLFRVNTGVGWVGRVISKTTGRIILGDPRPLHAGLCAGGSDIIGLRRVTITPDMVGTVIAQFVAIEVKTPGDKQSDEQERFLEMVRASGGFALEARDVDSVLAALSERAG
jgi:hypothetical protein